MGHGQRVTHEPCDLSKIVTHLTHWPVACKSAPHHSIHDIRVNSPVCRITKKRSGFIPSIVGPQLGRRAGINCHYDEWRTLQCRQDRPLLYRAVELDRVSVANQQNILCTTESMTTVERNEGAIRVIINRRTLCLLLLGLKFYHYALFPSLS